MTCLIFELDLNAFEMFHSDGGKIILQIKFLVTF